MTRNLWDCTVGLSGKYVPSVSRPSLYTVNTHKSKSKSVRTIIRSFGELISKSNAKSKSYAGGDHEKIV